MNDKKFKAIKNFIKDQSDILYAIIRNAVGDYEEDFDTLDPEEKVEYGWDIDDQQAEAKANK